MFLVKFNGRTQAIVITLVIAVMAVVGLLLLMTKLADSDTPPAAKGEGTPPAALPTAPSLPGPPDPDDVVATVNNQIITQQAWQQATHLDAIMSQLAAQPIPTAEETLDRLINEIIVLEGASTSVRPVEEAEIEARIQALEANWNITEDEVASALAEVGLERSDLTERVNRLIQVEAALNQLVTKQADLKTWLTTARASAEIGLYRSLVPAPSAATSTTSQHVPAQPPVENEVSAAATIGPAPGSTGGFAPPPEMAVSAYPQNAAPDFTLPQLDGNALTLSDLRGKPTIINFWATWCPPCRRELPALQAAYDAYGDKIGFIAVNVKEDLTPVTGLVEELGLNFPIALDQDGQISDITYQVRGLPTTVFVDANGVVAARHIGPLDEATIDSYLTPLLTEAETRGEEVNKDESLLSPGPAAPSLSTTAADFSLITANGDMVSLHDYRNKSSVVLVFYRGHT